MSLDHSVTSFKDAFAQAKHVIVIAGAGLSAPSGWQISNLSFKFPPDLGTPMAGIPTFRDGGGMWRSLDATSLATPEAFNTNPSFIWQFYHHRRQK
jgi:NAD-dependent deacetylase sirtuin 5